MFLLDPLARPSTYWMKFWVDMTRWIKRRSPTGAFDFFSYSELIYWFVFVSRPVQARGKKSANSKQHIVINPFRWKWIPFILMGVGIGLPLGVVEKEDRLRNELDMPADHKTHTY